TSHTSPPSPPSPPSGPPLGTCASRRMDTAPAPPSPPRTLSETSSTKADTPPMVGGRGHAAAPTTYQQVPEPGQLLDETDRAALDAHRPGGAVGDAAREVVADPPPGAAAVGGVDVLGEFDLELQRPLVVSTGRARRWVVGLAPCISRSSRSSCRPGDG